MEDEDFTKDLEDVSEIDEEDLKEEDLKEEFGEDLEDILSEDEKTTDEEFRFRTDHINRILANPWRNVSQELPEIIPIKNLEENLPKETKKEEKEEEDKIEYGVFDKEELGGQYKNPTSDTDLYEQKLSEGERNLEKQRKMYDSPKRLRPEINREKGPEAKYVKIEDTIRTDYLVKKKFGE